MVNSHIPPKNKRKIEKPATKNKVQELQHGDRARSYVLVAVWILSYGFCPFPSVSQVHLITLDDLIFFISPLCRIKVPSLNFPTCPAGQMLGTDFFLLAFLKYEGGKKWIKRNSRNSRKCSIWWKTSLSYAVRVGIMEYQIIACNNPRTFITIRHPNL